MSPVPFSRLVALLVRSVCTILAACGLALTPFFAELSAATAAFDPEVDGTVFVLATQADGKVIVGGQFTSVAGAARRNLARLNPDGTLDSAFNPTASAPVRAIALQRDGRILIGGDFTSLQPGASGTPVVRNRLARLNADGTVDAAFNPNLGGQLQPQVFALLVLPDGRIVVGGSFTTVQPPGVAVPFFRTHLARLYADGSLDLGFDPNPNGFVLALALHVDDKVVIGGGFTSLWAAGDPEPSTRNRIARLNPNGTLDSEFNPDANGSVTSLTVQRDGKILIGGSFSTLHPPTDESAYTRARIARLNVDGTLDYDFQPHADGLISAVAVQPDGALVIGGSFTSVWGRGGGSFSRSFLARFHPDGTVDPDFAPSINGAINALTFQADGRIVIGGLFTWVTPQGASSAIMRQHLARLNPDGSFDASFELPAGGRPLVSVTQADGKVVIGGSFTNVAGITRNYAARLNADGSLDAAYNPNCNGPVYAMALQPDGKVIIGGAFTTVGEEKRNYLARLNPSGTIDSEFNPHFDGQVGAIVLLSDGRMLIGGAFSNVQPVREVRPRVRAHLLRLNADGTLDAAFDPEPNSTVAAIAVQSDGKILAGGLFSTVQPGGAPTVTAAADGTLTTTYSTATISPRSYLARFNADGSLDTAFDPTLNGQVSALAVQSDGKIILAGAFSTIDPVGDKTRTVTTDTGETATTTVWERKRIARLNADGTLDESYDPNANGNVLALVLQSDGKLIIGGSFTTLTPNGAAAGDWILRKYAARLNADGTVDAAFNLDLSELSGNRVDSLRLQSDGRLFVGGNFTSLQPIGSPARVTRRNFARLLANFQVDTSFDPAAGGATGAIVNGLAMQPDGRVIAVGSFTDLGGAKSSNLARFRPEGAPDPNFSTVLSTDGPVNAVVVRPNGEPVPSQLGGFAWLNANGTLRTAFATARARLSGEINAVVIDARGRLLLGGTFTNLDNTTGSNFVRFLPNGTLDESFNPNPNGAVTGIAVQSDSRIVIVGNFTIIGDTARSRIARIDDDGSLDVTYDPSANGKISALVLDGDGRALIGGEFTSLTPNLTTTAVSRNYLARVNVDGTLDTNYNPTPNYYVRALLFQSDGKLVAGGEFTSVTPNGATTATIRNYVARFNADGTVDSGFDPNPNGIVYALAPLSGGRYLLGGAFTTLQPYAGGPVYTRNYLARVYGDGGFDQGFNPNPNGTVSTLAVQPDGGVLVGGSFTNLQPDGTGTYIARNYLVRLGAEGSLDLNFNPDFGGLVHVVAARPDGSILVGGNFSDLQLNGALMIGGSFASVGGVAARNLAMVNANGSVTTAFQPQPNSAVHALLVLPDGRTIVGGAFTNIAGVARNRLARLHADGSFDATYNASAASTVRTLALQPDGRVLVGSNNLVRLNADGTPDASFTASVTGPVTSLAVQADGRILYAVNQSALARLNADGSADRTFTAAAGAVAAIALQADGRIVIGGTPARLVRLNANGTPDNSFAHSVDGAVTALALQPDGRLMIGGGFRTVDGQTRPSIARVATDGDAAQTLGVAANRGSVVLDRSGAIGEIAAVIFEQSSDRTTWAFLGQGERVPGTANWQLAGLGLPASGVFYIRARCLVPSTAGTSSGLYQTAREFTYSSPVPGLAIPASTTVAPAQAAQVPIDVATGIIPRSVLSLVPGEGTVEIIVGGARPTAGTSTARLANLSTRGRVTAGNPLILGFTLAGTGTRPVLVRGVGPALNLFGVTGALPAPRLQVYDSAGALLAGNQGWANAPGLAQTAARTGAFPLPAGSADSAALLQLAPGSYTMQIDDPHGAAGVALAEIYDAGSGGGARLVNVSSRSSAGSGADVLISGFVLAGGHVSRVLLRGVGPGLAQFGTANPVADPLLSLYDSTGTALGANDNWVASVGDIALAAARAGAFPLVSGSKDAAVLATLPDGTYTIQVSADATRTALLEIYEVP